MPGTPSTAPAARRLRARLIAAVVVLAGLLALSGSQCADRMGADMDAGTGMSAAMTVDVEAGGGHSDGPGDAGGVLALCLALLFVVISAAAGLRPSWPRIVARLRRSWRVGVVHAGPVRAPSLAYLCVLRV